MIRTSHAWYSASAGLGRSLCRLAIVVVAGLSAPGFAAAQGSAAGQQRANAFSLSIGLFRPADRVFGTVYGGRQVPISFQASHRVWRRLSVFGGVRYSRLHGQAQPLGDSGPGEEYAVRLSTLTLRAGLLVAIPLRDWVFEIGGGPTLGRYAEGWPAVPAAEAITGAASGTTEVRTTRAGAIVQLGASRPVSRRLGVVGRVEYSLVEHAPAQQGDSTVSRNLGGFEATIGLVLRF